MLEKDSPRHYRIGAVSFLNTIPLIDWLVHGDDSQAEVVRDLPSLLPEQLSRGEIDVGLLPVVEIFRGTGWGMFGGTGIAGLGNVDSVKLFAGGSLEHLERVVVDRGSRTSVALLEILFRELVGDCPEFVVAEPQVGWQPRPGEGCLVIGDRCFQFDKFFEDNPAANLRVLDLGALWTELTGCPFVFAAWAVGPGFLSEFGKQGAADLKALIEFSRDQGLANLTSLASREAAAGQLGIGGQNSAEAIETYFRCSLKYELGQEEMAGLNQFMDLCLKHGLVEPGNDFSIL